MASKHLNLINTLLILTILFIFSPHTSLAIVLISNTSNNNIPTPLITTKNNNNNNNTISHQHEAICNSTPHPSACLSNLLPFNQTPRGSDARDFARFFLRKSLTSAQSALSLIDAHLRPATLPEPTVRALEDCRLLTELTVDSIARTYRTINSTGTLGAYEAEDLETLLSAVLTNQETCLEGLGEVTSSPTQLRDRLGAHLSVGKKLYSISLALFKHGWVDDHDDDDDDDDDCDDSSFTSPSSHHNVALKRTTKQRKLVQTISTGSSGPSLGGVLVSQMVVVNRNGTGNFTTISDAVNAAPNNTAMLGRGNITSTSTAYFVIYVTRGVYEEYVSIGTNKQNLMMIGDGIDQTIITGNRSVVDGWTTYNSATFAVTGQGFIAINITFRNTAGAIKRQAVAVRNGADLSAFRGCSFEGYQDTLYAHSLRQFYRDCDIYGTVDFIFGNAAAVLQNCNIFARRPLPNQFNAVTAQGRSDPNQNTGTSIHNCAIRASPDLAAANANATATVNATRTYLGRPWREYSRTVFMQSFMGSLIDPAGWREWSGNFALGTLYYAEFNNTGPGSNTSQRVAWPGYVRAMGVSDAANFTVSSFIAGDAWLLGATGVPYTAGLLV